MSNATMYAIYLMVGYDEQVLKAGKYAPLPVFQDQCGHSGVALFFEQCGHLIEAAIPPDDEHPGVLYYDVIEPLGAWFYAHSEVDETVFMAQFRIMYENYMGRGSPQQLTLNDLPITSEGPEPDSSNDDILMYVQYLAVGYEKGLRECDSMPQYQADHGHIEVSSRMIEYAKQIEAITTEDGRLARALAADSWDEVFEYQVVEPLGKELAVNHYMGCNADTFKRMVEGALDKLFRAKALAKLSDDDKKSLGINK